MIDLLNWFADGARFAALIIFMIIFFGGIEELIRAWKKK